MKEKVEAILKLMEVMGVSIEDLQVYRLKTTNKFPLEVYYDDKTKSDDIAYYKEHQNRHPIGIVIGKTVFALPFYIDRLSCGYASMYCRSNFENCGALPTVEQVKSLKAHWDDYNFISVFLKSGRLDDCEYLSEMLLAVSHPDNSMSRQYYYDLKKDAEFCHNDITPTLPVINL